MEKNYTKLYIVATPIGNLSDITLRALETLKNVDYVLAEDTRVSRKLFNHYQINTPLFSYNAHTSNNKEEKIISLLQKGKNLALISDAGTPTISDPGVKLIQTIKERLPDVEILTIPGPSALIAALSISGVSSSEFIFYGFLPAKKGRETLFKEIALNKKTSVFYESTHKLEKALKSLEQFCPNKTIFIAKELTKIHEQTFTGTATELLKFLSKNPEKKKGEFVVIVK